MYHQGQTPPSCKILGSQLRLNLSDCSFTLKHARVVTRRLSQRGCSGTDSSWSMELLQSLCSSHKLSLRQLNLYFSYRLTSCSVKLFKDVSKEYILKSDEVGSAP